ncbi:unnamed protein product [Tuber aestivum]|uniref:ACB domain-containing protein n=1 Tax=Tuber aestivum TaxID=59557 RepID=A0A292PLC6_9PEZI|nr:unnamed protein product [Tuber aestivum]
MTQYKATPAFETARRNIDGLKDAPNPIASPDQHDQLLAYCLFKQTTKGDVTGSRPFFGAEAVKFDARALVRGTARQEADARYVNCAGYILEGMELSEENKDLLEKIRKLGTFSLLNW